MKVLVLLLLFLSTGLSAQPVSVSVVSIVPKSERYDNKDTSIRYPIFRFKDAGVESNVNRAIYKQLLLEDLPSGKITASGVQKKILKAVAELNLTELLLDTITYSDRRILSFQIFTGGVGAYYWTSTSYFAFDLWSGDRLGLTDFIRPEKLATFYAQLEKKHRVVGRAFRDSAQAQLLRDELDSSVYESILHATRKDCLDHLNQFGYIFHCDKLEIIVDCEFPHYIQSVGNPQNVVFTKEEIEEFLKEQFQPICGK